MDDLYAINAAKSEFREGFNLADPSRMLAIADPDLVNFSDGLRAAVNPSVAGIATWTSGGEIKKVSGSYGCTWITRTSPTHFGRNKFHRPVRKFTEVSEASCITAC